MNALLVFTQFHSALLPDGAKACIDAFDAGGVTFFQAKQVFDASDGQVAEELQRAMDEADVVAVMVDASRLNGVQSLLSNLLGVPLTQSTAWGAGVFSKDGKNVLLFSPSDVAYVSNVLVPHLKNLQIATREYVTIRTIGVSEDELSSLIAAAKRMSGDRLEFRLHVSFDEGVIKIGYGADVPKMLLDDVLRLFAQSLEGQVYALDDTPLENQLVHLLKLRSKKIAVAESFTGGGVASRIVSVPGASAVYLEGLNTYSENAKQIRLGVSAYTLNTFGAVSDATAYEMAAGLLSTSGADVVIATTGLAGPTSDRSDLPVGLAYIAVGTREKIFVYRYHFDGDRRQITQKAINHALFDAYRHLKNI